MFFQPFFPAPNRRKSADYLPLPCLLLCSLLPCLAVRAAAPEFAPTPTANHGFVRAKDAAFFLDGKPFRYLGGNNYPLLQAEVSQASLDLFFAQCQKQGIAVVRTWAFNAHTPAQAGIGNFVFLQGTHLQPREEMFRSMDLVLARARAFGIRLILVLQDNNGGHKAEWCQWSNVLHGTHCETTVGDDFYTEPAVQADFKAYVRWFVTRVNTCNGVAYRDDPTIFSWELVNEGRYTANEGPIDLHPGTVASSRVVALTDWYADLSAYLKTLDGNHLVGTGSISQYADYTPNDPVHNGSYYGLDYRTQHQLASIDYFDFHFYPYADPPKFGLRAFGQNALGNVSPQPTGAGLLAQLRQFVNDAHRSGKPVTIGEYGVDRRNTLTSDDYVTYPRAQNFARFAADWFGLGGDGLTLWHFSNLFDDDTFNIRPGSPHTGDHAHGDENDDDANLLQNLRRILQDTQVK